MSFSFRPAKQFTDRHGLFVGLTGGTNSGKTFSALRLARGIAGPEGKIAVLDTEGGRTLHLKEHFDFDASLLDPPFRPEKFAAGTKAAEDAGYDCCVIDSFTMEWVGLGGVLDWQEEELQAAVQRAQSRNDRRTEYAIREAGKMAAWIKPKMAHKSMVYGLLQRRMPIIFAIRGEETVKAGGEGNRPEKIFKSICSPTFPFEITVSFRLATEARGMIDLSDPKSYKMEGPHQGFFKHGEQISEEHGARLAAWARGETAGLPAPKPPPKPEHPTMTPRERFPDLFDIPDGNIWMANLQRRLDAAQAEDDIAEITGLSSVTITLRSAPDNIKEKITGMLGAAMTRVNVTQELANEPADPNPEPPAD